MKEVTAIISIQIFLVLLIFFLAFYTVIDGKKKMKKITEEDEETNCPEGCYGKRCPHGNKCFNCHPPNIKCCCYDFQCEKCAEKKNKSLNQEQEQENKENDGIIREDEEEEPSKVYVSTEEHPYKNHSKINDIITRKNKLITIINKKVKNLNSKL